MSKVETFGAAGMVKTGYSCPYVAEYESDGQGNITYSNGRRLGRGVSAQLSPTVTEASYFSADNGMAENDGAKVSAGVATLTIDGLLPEVRRFITGQPARATGEKFDKVGDAMQTNRPELGLGYIVRYMCAGVTLYQPFILARAKYVESERTVNTQEYNSATNWQTSPLQFNYFTAEDEGHTIEMPGDFYTTEAEAENDIKTTFGI